MLKSVTCPAMVHKLTLGSQINGQDPGQWMWQELRVPGSYVTGGLILYLVVQGFAATTESYPPLNKECEV